MVMQLRQNNNGFKYFMNDHMLDAVYEEKDLGVFITHNLKPARLPASTLD